MHEVVKVSSNSLDIYHLVMQCASSTTKAINLFIYVGVRIISLHVRFVKSSSGLMKSNWYSPFFFFLAGIRSPRQWHKLQTNLLKIETPPWEKNEAVLLLIQTITMALSTWSFIRALRGDTTIASRGHQRQRSE